MEEDEKRESQTVEDRVRGTSKGIPRWRRAEWREAKWKRSTLVVGCLS